ncbi:MAG: ferredoxin reductase [Candidatus Dormibacteria bacterium]
MAGTALQRRLSWHIAEVVDVVDETPRVRTIMLTVPDWPGHLAGQHVDVRLTADDGYQTQRSYSIASAPSSDQRIALTVERLDDGEVSPYLAGELHAGDKLELRGPIGGYFVWEAALGGPLLLVAGGSGICPLMAMLRLRHAAGSTVPTRLLYSSRSLEEVIFRDELDTLVAMDAGLEVIHTLTRTQPPDWTGQRRRIDAAMLTQVAWPAAQRPLIFVCGPTPLVESVAESLVQLGHEPTRIKTERFGPTGG